MASEKPVAIVTGGAQGLGYAIVRELLDNGYKVCMADITEEIGTNVTRDLQVEYDESNIVFRVCDVTQKSHYTDVFEYVLKEFGRLDLLINNAGVGELDPKTTIETNLIGPTYGCQLALKYMGKDDGGNGGMVINVASLVGLHSFQRAPVYSASKHGVVALTRSYGKELHYTTSGVVFSALCPGRIKTNLLKKFTEKTRSTPVFSFAEGDIMESSYVAKAVTKLIQDRKNGGVLMVSGENCFGFKYNEEAETEKDEKLTHFFARQFA